MNKETLERRQVMLFGKTDLQNYRIVRTLGLGKKRKYEYQLYYITDNKYFAITPCFTRFRDIWSAYRLLSLYQFNIVPNQLEQKESDLYKTHSHALSMMMQEL